METRRWRVIRIRSGRRRDSQPHRHDGNEERPAPSRTSSSSLTSAIRSTQVCGLRGRSARRGQAIPHGHQRRELPRARGADVRPRGQGRRIYIDPPYNSGARDWKYNNDYVDEDDAYRHSKWLAIHGARLRFAQRLLKPEDSVLIVTIDEKEYSDWGCSSSSLPRG